MDDYGKALEIFMFLPDEWNILETGYRISKLLVRQPNSHLHPPRELQHDSSFLRLREWSGCRALRVSSARALKGGEAVIIITAAAATQKADEKRALMEAATEKGRDGGGWTSTQLRNMRPGPPPDFSCSIHTGLVRTTMSTGWNEGGMLCRRCYCKDAGVSGKEQAGPGSSMPANSWKKTVAAR
ncbi:hypothetical protein BJV77DRAFT_966255 [Russula vinacea]|nr:hypothetical protein BJV77DRAFT_966255 [Russula vinacea]